MTAPKSEQLRAQFEAASLLEGAARTAYLDRVCAKDSALRRRLEGMLLAAEDEHFLSAPTYAAPVPKSGGVQVEGPGTLIDRYQLIEVLGEGGFGTVWSALQRESVQRTVALKILKPGMDTQQVISRFEQERQALALMDHPNIARVLDGGATPTGRPYFVMELVRGVPIIEYCDAARLDTPARLRLFIDVCRAIQHAHQKGIIHRDIKPSNVLVAVQDGLPVPKVIDFGIAKALNAELEGRAHFTEHRQVIGTPAYMSPEQTELTGRDIDTRSDVYSLGVLLYELLTGTTPFDVRDLLEHGFDEILRTIREVEPHRPSTRIANLGVTAERTADSRQLDVRRLGTQLRGELDWIVMRCLEKDRARRYESASGLWQDVERHLKGESVLAAPPAAGYRFRKFLRRHRRTVAVGALLFVSLVVGLATTLWQARAAARQRDLFRDAAELAEQRADQLARVSAFQANMLEQLDATELGAWWALDLRERNEAALAKLSLSTEEREADAQAFRRELARVNATDSTVALLDRALLAPAVAATAKEFGGEPLVDAMLRQTLGNIYAKLGRFDQARTLLEWVYAIRGSALGKDDADTLRTANDLGTVLDNLGEFAAAEGHFRFAAEGRARLHGAQHPETLTSRGNLGGNLRFQGRFEEARSILEEVLDATRRVLGSEARDTLVRINVLGYLYVDQGLYAEAEPFWREAFETGKRAFGASDRDTLIWGNNLGGLLGILGRVDEAQVYLRETLEASRAALGDEHPTTLNVLASLASEVQRSGRGAEAAALALEALDGRRRVFGDDHPDTLSSMRLLATIQRGLGRVEEAEALLREVLTGTQRVFGPRHANVYSTKSQLAGLVGGRGELAGAVALYLETLDAPESVWSERHPDRLIVQNNYGLLLASNGRAAEAEPILRQTFALGAEVRGPDHPETLITQSALAYALEELGRHEEALEAHSAALAGLRRVQGETHPNSLSSMCNVSKVLHALGRDEEAEPLAREAAIQFAERVGQDHRRTGRARAILGEVLVGLGRFPEAEVELLEAQRVLAAAEAVDPRALDEHAVKLVTLYEAWDAAIPGADHTQEAARWRAP